MSAPWGSMPWGRARRAAARAATARPSVAVPLADAVGLVLASAAVARTALPPFDVATVDGYAVSGPGPWTLDEPAGERLADGAATPVAVATALPAGADAVVPRRHAVIRVGKEVTWLYVGDAETGRQAERPGHVPPGTGIATGGEECAAGGIVAPAGALATPALIGAAASAGLDVLDVVRPPDVAVIVLGDRRLTSGPARGGRARDPVRALLPGALLRAGARCLPLQQVPGDPGSLHDAVRAAVDDVAADLVLLTGEPGAVARDDAVRALAALDSRPVVADVAVRPGGDVLLAELADGRLVAYVPGDLPGAISALVTVVVPLLRGMCGRSEPEPVLALLDTAVPGDPHRTLLVGANRRHGELTDTAELTSGGTALALAASPALAVVPPGGAAAGQLVELVDGP